MNHPPPSSFLIVHTAASLSSFKTNASTDFCTIKELMYDTRFHHTGYHTDIWEHVSIFYTGADICRCFHLVGYLFKIRHHLISRNDPPDIRCHSDSVMLWYRLSRCPDSSRKHLFCSHLSSISFWTSPGYLSRLLSYQLIHYLQLAHY